jgi:hypothetical protein
MYGVQPKPKENVLKPNIVFQFCGPIAQAVYQGRDCQTEVIDLIPRYIKEKEPDYTCLCTFAVQTIGIDYPMREASLFSEEVVTLLRPEENVSDTSILRQRIKTVREIDKRLLHSWGEEHWAEGTGKDFI